MRKVLNRVANPGVAFLLKSPLHRLLSGRVMLITVTGRRSGRSYTTPVEYERSRDQVHAKSWSSRTWWRNLEGGAPVSVLVRGRWLQGRGVAERTDEKAPEGSALINITVTLEPEGLP
jgi:hypothetical protein